MKNQISVALLVSTLSAPLLSQAQETEQLLNESRGAVKQLFNSLSSTLVAAMKAGGPAQAIAACNINAQPLTQGVSSSLGYEVARTSLRLRNPENEADAWEIKVLQQFEARKAAGEELMKMEYHEVVEREGKRQFRYMKAIPAGKPCMTCHGDLVAPEVLKKIRELYPMDQATGFKPGDLRGAFTITRDL
jgi:hypothetical protein